jgi:hypothetical protein
VSCSQTQHWVPTVFVAQLAIPPYISEVRWSTKAVPLTT